MFAFVDFEAILEDEFCFLGSGAQFGIFGGFDGSHAGAGKALQGIFQFCDALDDFRRGDLRLDVGIESDFSLDLLDIFGDGGVAVVYGMDDLRDNAGEWIDVRHEGIIPQGNAQGMSIDLVGGLGSGGGGVGFDVVGIPG